MSYKDLAKSILELIGSETNISSLTHCATRLRFNLKDDKKAKTEEIKKLKGVMGVVNSGGQYQIIIGSDVASVYKPLVEMTKIQEGKGEKQKEEEKKSLGARAIDTLSGIFTPILPALTAAGMLKAVLSLLVAFKVVSSDQQSYQILNFMGDATFYFLPILLANSASKKFKCNSYLAMMLGGILLHPNFVSMVASAQETGETIHLFAIPIYGASYSSSVIPIILSVWFMSLVEPIADKVSPKAVKFFTKPLLTILVSGIVALSVLGPVGYIISNYIADFLRSMEAYGWAVSTVLGAIFPLLVMTGTHYAIVPIGINNRMTMGYDTMVYPNNLASNIAQGGATLAVGVKSKVSDIKQLAFSSGITAVCGITEPALYGINVRFRTPLYAAMIGGGVGGFFVGLMGVRNYAGGSPGLLTLPSYIGEDSLRSFYMAIIGAAIAFVVAFVISFILYKDPVEEVETQQENKELEKETAEKKERQNVPKMEGGMTVYAPVTGKAVPLKEVNDPTFAEEILGKGVAIIPEEGLAVSPINGTVVNIFDTLHAIGLKSDDGVEVLIHIGLDTVKLGGKHFKAIAKSGDRVEIGAPLVEFDIDKIKEEGYDVITPVIISNSFEYGTVLSIDGRDIVVGDELIKVIK